MSDKTWKDALLGTGQPLEHSAARVLAGAGADLTPPREYSYVRPNENGVPTEFSVDLHTSQMAELGTEIPYWVDYLIECKYRRPGTRWIFTPEEYDGVLGPSLKNSLVTLDALADDYSVNRAHLESFSKAYTFCSRGCEIFEKERNLAGIDQAVNQLKYAVPNLVADAIWHQLGRHLGPKAQVFLIAPIVLTTAELWCLNNGTTIESVRAATELSDVATKADILILYQPPDNFLERYTQSTLKQRFEAEDVALLDKRLNARAKHSFEFYTQIIARNWPSHFVVVHYSRFQECIRRLTAFAASAKCYEKQDQQAA